MAGKRFEIVLRWLICNFCRRIWGNGEVEVKSSVLGTGACAALRSVMCCIHNDDGVILGSNTNINVSKWKSLILLEKIEQLYKGYGVE